MNYTNLSLLVSSFDKYSVCWEPFCHGLKKYWPDHPPLFYITNHLEAPYGVSLKVGDDQGWAQNLLLALNDIPTDYVLYAQEDYWIKAPVDNQNILDYLSYLESGLADYIRLHPVPGPDSKFDEDERLGGIGTNSIYRTSLQMAIWRKETLKSLIDPNESPWQFEVDGSKRSETYKNRFWSTTKRRHGVDYVFTAIKNGYWTKMAREYVEKEGIEVEFDLLPAKKFTTKLADLVKTRLHQLKKYLKTAG